MARIDSDSVSEAATTTAQHLQSHSNGQKLEELAGCESIVDVSGVQNIRTGAKFGVTPGQNRYK